MKTMNTATTKLEHKSEVNYVPSYNKTRSTTISSLGVVAGGVWLHD